MTSSAADIYERYNCRAAKFFREWQITKCEGIFLYVKVINQNKFNVLWCFLFFFFEELSEKRRKCCQNFVRFAKRIDHISGLLPFLANLNTSLQVVKVNFARYPTISKVFKRSFAILRNFRLTLEALLAFLEQLKRNDKTPGMWSNFFKYFHKCFWQC